MFQRLGAHIWFIGFVPTDLDLSLFVYKSGDDLAYLLIYVNDIILTASTTPLLQCVKELCCEFAIKDLRALRFFLGV